MQQLFELNDLFYHLNAFEIELLPLRERKEDIFLLTKYFIQRFNYVYDKEVKWMSAQVEQLIKTYKWPGNVSELKNVIERAVIMIKPTNITANELIKVLEVNEPKSKIDEKPLKQARDEFEKEYIIKILSKNDWSLTKTAQVLSIDRTHLYRKCKQLKIELHGQ